MNFLYIILVKKIYVNNTCQIRLSCKNLLYGHRNLTMFMNEYEQLLKVTKEKK